ncbi:hypothetical protein V1511DRAFT_494024 [Dipodascopsis uninucleata]
MASFTVLITGATGILGRQVLKQFATDHDKWNVVGTGFTRCTGSIIRLDLQDKRSVKKLLLEKRPSVIVHTAAERRPDIAAQRPEQVKELNIEATRYLASLASDLNIPFLYLSTDYVFDGTKAPYEPGDTPNPTNFYGETKLAGEKVALEECKKTIVLRVPVLYGNTEVNEESAINVLIDVTLNEDQKPAESVGMDNWQIRYPTNTSDVARVIKSISDLAMQGTMIPNILHFSSDERFTKYEICQIFGEILGVPIGHLKRIDSYPEVSRTPSGIVRPYNTQLSVQLLKDIGIDCSSVDFREWWKKELLPNKRR